MIYNQCKENGIFTFNDLILHNFILTATVVVRAKLLYGEYNDFFKEWETQNFGDYQIWLYASSMGYIMRFSETMTVYRILDNSASHYTDSVSKLRWMQSEFYLFDYFDSRFNIPKSTRKEALFLRCSAWGSTAIKLNNKELIKRIGAFYRDNKFYIAWLSFVIMYKYPHINFISKFIESQERIKAPFRYLKSKWSMYKKSNINGYKY